MKYIITIIVFAFLTNSLSLKAILPNTCQEDNEYVILVNSYNYSHTWISDVQMRLMEVVLQQDSAMEVEIFNGSEMWDLDYDEACSMFSEVYYRHNHKPKAILFIGAVGWEIYRETHPGNWKDIPLVLAGVGDSTLNFKTFKTENIIQPESVLDNTSGYQASITVRDYTLDRTVSLMRDVIPGLKDVVLLVDKTMTARAIKQYLPQIININKDLNYRFIDKTDVSSRQLLDILKDLSPQTGVIFISWLLEKDEPLFSPDPTVFYKRITANVVNPVFTTYDINYKDHIFVGGTFGLINNLVDAAINHTSSVVGGMQESRRIENVTPLLKSHLDYEVLKEYPLLTKNIHTLIQKGVIIDNLPLPVWKKYQTELIFVFASVIIILLLLVREIIKLRIINHRKRKLQKHLYMSAEIYDKMPTLYARYRLLYDKNDKIKNIVLLICNKAFRIEYDGDKQNNSDKECQINDSNTRSKHMELFHKVDKEQTMLETVMHYWTDKYYKLSVFPTDTKGEVEVFFTDITDLVRTQNELKNYHEKRASIYKNMPLAVAILDANFCLVDSNKAFSELLKTNKTTLDEVYAQKRTFTLFSKEEQESIKQDRFTPREAVLNEKFINALGVQTTYTSAPVVWCEVKTMSEKQSDTPFYVVILIEHSRINQVVERIIADSNMTAITLAEVLNSLDIPLAIKDCEDDYRYVYWNKAAEEMSNIKAHEIIGRTDFDIVLDRNPQCFREEDLLVSLQDIALEKEDIYFDCPVMLRKSCIEGNNGHKWLLSTKWDITSLKNTQLQLERAKEKAEESNRLKSAFLANMSHEIRTPLNAIVGFSEVLVEADTDEERDEYCQHILNNTEILLHLISDILELSKIESGNLEFAFNECSIHNITQKLDTRIREILSKKGILFKIHGNIPTKIITDEGRVFQVLEKLISNACKFTSVGTITLTYGIDEGGNKIRFDISDTGCGIPQDKLSAIFERFIKLDEFKQGVGLGLPICRAVVSKLGGEIWAVSEINKGTTFSFTIPFVKSEKKCINATYSDGTTIKNGNTQNKKTILIAEDTLSNYKLFETYLKHNYNLLHVEDGTEVIGCFQANNPDIVLMDIKMPIMNGYDALKAIRTIDTKTPVVAVTAFAMKDDQDNIFKAGFNGFISKPIRRQEILNIIEQLLN
ncbi:MAG: ATP-binding protein [Marinifilaceae bacterium]